MKTETLIETLSADLLPARAGQISRTIALVAAVGVPLAGGLVLWWLGMRPDLLTAVVAPMFWIKAAYAALLALAGFLALDRLARPTGDPRPGLILAAVVILLLAGAGALQIMTAPAEIRTAMWMGQSWRECPIRILVLSTPVLAASLLTARRFAPTRLVLAGGAAGLFAGGLAATAYGLHCPEATAAFVATWYSLGVILSTTLGAVLGPWVLRWR